MCVSRAPSRCTTTPVTAVPASLVSRRRACALVSMVTLACSSAGRTPRTSASDFACTRHGKPSHVEQRTQRAVGHVVLGEHHAAGRVERLVPGRGEVVGELLDARLVADGRERVGSAGRRLGGILAAGAVHAVELLGARVVGLHLVVADGPRRRGAVVVMQQAEVLLAQAVERGAVELRRAADAVVHLWLEGLAVAVVPRVLGHVAVVHEDVPREPVLRLAREPVAPLEQEDALPGRGEVPGERPAAGASADHDHVVVTHQLSSSSRSARMIRPAASISARCEKACGKLPRCRPVSASNSSA